MFGLPLKWEGIGVSSFLLIGFWLTRVQANKAAIQALTINRVGDMALSIGFMALLWVFGSLEYAPVLATASYMNETAVTLLGLLLLVGAMAKSAQVPLHTWLPSAMEGLKLDIFYNKPRASKPNSLLTALVGPSLNTP